MIGIIITTWMSNNVKLQRILQRIYLLVMVINMEDKQYAPMAMALEEEVDGTPIFSRSGITLCYTFVSEEK